MASAESIQRIISKIKKYWDCSCKKGTIRTILGYKFAINTGASPPVCCIVPRYIPNESNIIIYQIGNMLKNDCIEECKVPWRSQIVLVAKPHQEHIENIEDCFGACVYRMLDSIKSLDLSSIQYLDVMMSYQLLKWAHL